MDKGEKKSNTLKKTETQPALLKFTAEYLGNWPEMNGIETYSVSLLPLLSGTAQSSLL